MSQLNNITFAYEPKNSNLPIEIWRSQERGLDLIVSLEYEHNFNTKYAVKLDYDKRKEMPDVLKGKLPIGPYGVDSREEAKSVIQNQNPFNFNLTFTTKYNQNTYR